jgi:hypothetical protein
MIKTPLVIRRDIVRLLAAIYGERSWPVAKFWRGHDVEAKYGQRVECPAFPMIIV